MLLAHGLARNSVGSKKTPDTRIARSLGPDLRPRPSDDEFIDQLGLRASMQPPE